VVKEVVPNHDCHNCLNANHIKQRQETQREERDRKLREEREHIARINAIEQRAKHERDLKKQYDNNVATSELRRIDQEKEDAWRRKVQEHSNKEQTL
jgi:hypothetical protein